MATCSPSRFSIPRAASPTRAKSNTKRRERLSPRGPYFLTQFDSRLARRVVGVRPMLVDGKWTDAWQPVQATDAKGGFVRQASSFRDWVSPDGAAGPTGKGGFRAEKGRYHLYAAFTCPWATRVLIARKLKRLEDVVSVAIVEPVMTDEGWRFGDYPNANRDEVNGATYLHEIYTRADPHYTGRATVPALWDKERRTIVNNESADLLRMFNSGFGALANA